MKKYAILLTLLTLAALSGMAAPSEGSVDPDMRGVDPAVLQEAVHVGECTITHYCTCQTCCGKTDGITYSGRPAEPEYSVAVDRRLIPLGAAVVLEWPDGRLQLCRADDIGGFSGRHIDLCVADHMDAARRGIQKVNVWYVEG